MKYKEKKKRILEITGSFSEEERLRWELERIGIGTNNIGKVIGKLLEKYGSVNKVAQELGVSEDWLNYYIQHLPLNEPAPAIEEKTIEPVQNVKDHKEDFVRYIVRKKR
jgi:hypothetical protein